MQLSLVEQHGATVHLHVYVVQPSLVPINGHHFPNDILYLQILTTCNIYGQKLYRLGLKNAFGYFLAPHQVILRLCQKAVSMKPFESPW